MDNFYLIRFCILALAMFMLSPSADLRANENNAAEVSCKSKLVAVGRPNQIETIAQLNAVGAWITRARKIGETYAEWRYADKAQVSCEKKGSSGFYLCRASGKPCPAKSSQKPS
ncbi:MAG: hypothetical protein ACR2OW_02235 [Methyloligellaceae bacterium]